MYVNIKRLMPRRHSIAPDISSQSEDEEALEEIDVNIRERFVTFGTDSDSKSFLLSARHESLLRLQREYQEKLERDLKGLKG